jgi:hypothetical protein
MTTAATPAEAGAMTTTPDILPGKAGVFTEIVQTIDTLIARAVALSHKTARLKLELSDLAEERRLREAVLALSIEGKNADERAARLRLELSSDADYRRLAQAEKDARLKLAETEAALWASRQKVATCLALLPLAGGTGDGAGAGDGDPGCAGGETKTEEAVP